MIELIVFIWVLGWLFGLGASWTNSIKKGESKVQLIIAVPLCFLIWPIYLGGCWAEK